jgi:hypothetical protein
MRAAVFADRRKAVALLCRDLVVFLRDGEGAKFDEAKREKLLAALGRMRELFGYNEASAKDVASTLVRWRFADLVT